MGEQRTNWEEVVALNPHGYAEFQSSDGTTVFHGPVESVTIDGETDWVKIKLLWVAKSGTVSQPNFGHWEFIPEGFALEFPNHALPFKLQTVPKGQRILFAGSQILYLEAQSGLDTAKIRGFVQPEPKPAPESAPAPVSTE